MCGSIDVRWYGPLSGDKCQFMVLIKQSTYKRWEFASFGTPFISRHPAEALGWPRQRFAM